MLVAVHDCLEQKVAAWLAAAETKLAVAAPGEVEAPTSRAAAASLTASLRPVTVVEPVPVVVAALQTAPALVAGSFLACWEARPAAAEGPCPRPAETADHPEP